MFSRALFVGINHYNDRTGRIPDLSGCLNDVDLITDALTKARSIDPAATMVLTDAQASFEALDSNLASMRDGLRPGERLLFYFSGHGVQVPDAQADETDGDAYDEALVTYGFSIEKPFLDDLLHAHLAAIPAGASACIILDCCHSGGMARAIAEGSLAEGGQPRGIEAIARGEYTPAAFQKLLDLKKAIRIEPRPEPACLLAACQPSELAWEYPLDNKRNGLFTYALAQALREAPGLTPRQMIDLAYEFIQRSGKQQAPRLIGEETLFDVPFSPQPPLLQPRGEIHVS